MNTHEYSSRRARRLLVAGASLVLTGMGVAFAQDPPPVPDSLAPPGPQMAPQGPPMGAPGSRMDAPGSPMGPRGPMGVRPRGVPLPPPPPDFFGPPPVIHVRDYAWAYVGIPEPREIFVHDILTIIVNEKAEVNAQSRYNRQRNGNLKAELKDFIRIGEDGTLDNAAENQPTVDANIQGRLQSSGQLSDQESIRYRIAATVVDVLPNGNIVLEARKSIRSNKDFWEYSLTGVLRPQDIGPDNTALSENIANLVVDKKSRGTVFDSTHRPWGLYLYDKLAPF